MADQSTFDVVDKFGLGFYPGNVVRHMLAYQQGSQVTDLHEARDYLDRMITIVEGAPEPVPAPQAADSVPPKSNPATETAESAPVPDWPQPAQ
jgi:hypothetical protein